MSPVSLLIGWAKSDDAFSRLANIVFHSCNKCDEIGLVFCGRRISVYTDRWMVVVSVAAVLYPHFDPVYLHNFALLKRPSPRFWSIIFALLIAGGSCKHGDKIWHQSRSDWPQFGPIMDFFCSDVSTFWLGEPKCTETDLKKSLRFVRFGANLTYFGAKPTIPGQSF